LNGYNGCVFAYGATGTGKTFTMLGNSQQPGLCNLTLKDIFSKINSAEYQNDKYDVKVCYVEIYNEAIRDLLVPKDNGNYLDLRDDPLKGVLIAGANEVDVRDTEEVCVTHLDYQFAASRQSKKDYRSYKC
jgi:kinesin family member 18/19